ncbi:unnamed protein product [Parnassius apollo]|uniref:(apollo) hypothetical protein n=1 Tax=Parnassius apollo TaxID=110799 RepID=A0A8S3WY56_PARAO|nr:unnamed protein product [Parnassius apollo]
MPRTYIRKKIKSYTPQDLAQAIAKVKNGELTQYRAAQEYKIPMTTLHENLKKGKETTGPNAGRPTVIRLEDEKKLAETVRIMEKWGYGLSRFEIMELVAEYVRVNKIQTPFKNNVPGTDWFINFRKRHRLSIKKAQPVEFVRRKMTDPFVIGEYFNLLENTLKDLDLFESPQLIWNLDETSLCLDPSRTKVCGQINKPCARSTHGSGKENITMLTGASANGKKLPPLIVFKGKFVWDQWMAELVGGDYDFELSYAASTKGWMETDIFYNYIEKVLIPSLGEERPVLIVYDGHSTHVHVRVVELAIRNRITILKLPPHTSHLLQPLDIAVFKSFKSIWDAKLVEWQRRNVGTKMPKKVFAQVLADTWRETNPNIIKSGFRKAGIFPFNAHVIPVDKYDPDAYKRQPTQLPACLQKSSNTDKDTLLSLVSKPDIQTLSFVAKQPSQIPICLQNSNQTSTQNLSKIKIISNVIIKKASPQLLQAQRLPEPSCTFEELLLRKIQQDKKDNKPTKKKHVTKGAEVITATMGKKILEETVKAKKAKANPSKIYKKRTAKVKNKEDSEITIFTAQQQEYHPGPSGIRNKKKRKRQPSLDSITSVSDIMSVHSDSDTIECVDFEELTDEYSENGFLTNKNLNPLCIKGKGVGKRSKGKENKVEEKVEENKEERLIERNYECDIDVFTKEKNMTTREFSKEKDKDEQLLLKQESKEIICETQEENLAMKENYQLNDSVLVRYLIRNKWKYFVGFIENIIKNEEIYFTINFLKTVRPQQRLTFITTKRKDIDKVPKSLIVKKIDLKKYNEKEYYLLNYEDTIYFD